jgi:hypothetical protein
MAVKLSIQITSKFGLTLILALCICEVLAGYAIAMAVASAYLHELSLLPHLP